MRVSRIAYYVAIATVAFIGAAHLVRSGLVDAHALPVFGAERSAPDPDTRPVRPGRELAVVFVTSPTCVWSNSPEIPSLIQRAKESVRRRGEEHGFGFAAVGVVRTHSVTAGMRHLAKFGEFDEVMAGRAWFNIGALKYVAHDMPGPRATPQIVIVERSVGSPDEPHLHDERVVARLIGVEPIKRWVESGTPLPTLQ